MRSQTAIKQPIQVSQQGDVLPALSGAKLDFFCTDENLPLVIQPELAELVKDTGTLCDWYRQHLREFDELLDHYGALLFRGFALPDTRHFHRIVDLYPTHSAGYVAGAAPRKRVEGNVYESTRMPAPFKIGMHQEKAYMADFPRLLGFYCKTAPQEGAGGETPLCDMRALTARLSPQLLDKFRAKGVMYLRNFCAPGDSIDVPKTGSFVEYHQSWVDAFGVEDREEVEALCAQRRLLFKWLDDGSLTVSHIGSATLHHPRTGAEVWFNQATAQHSNSRSMGSLSYRYLHHQYGNRLALPYEVKFGDGSPMSLDDLDAVYDAFDAEERAFPWQAGDFLLIDNILVAHGRNPFRGVRDIQVAMMD